MLKHGEQRWIDFDYIEIGTSDFRTLTQYVAGTDYSCPMGKALRNWSPSLVKGLAVDPVQHLLKRLPVLRGVQQVVAALGECDSTATLYSVREDVGWRFPTSYAAYLAEGCSRLHTVWPKLQHFISDEGLQLEDVFASTTVPVWSFATLVDRYGVASVDVLKLDCEGMDCAILKGLLRHCADYPDAFPRIISFETNSLTPRREVDAIVRTFRSHGYQVLYRGRDTVLKRCRSTALHPICCDFLAGRCADGKRCYFVHRNTIPTSVRECCYGDQCSRGHGGVQPRCVWCGQCCSLNTCLCDACWQDRAL